jgi:hypothetical protein
VRLAVVLAIGLGGAWYRSQGQEEVTPQMKAAIGRAFNEEAGFVVPHDYLIQPVRAGASAFVIRPDGQRFPARTVQVGSLAHRLYVDLVAAGADDPGPDRGVQEAMDGLREAYGHDLRPEDLLAVVPPGWDVRT